MKMGIVPACEIHILWFAKIMLFKNRWRISYILEFMAILPIPYGYPEDTTEGPSNAIFGRL
jgi:hypothetical protein